MRASIHMNIKISHVGYQMTDIIIVSNQLAFALLDTENLRSSMFLNLFRCMYFLYHSWEIDKPREQRILDHVSKWFCLDGQASYPDRRPAKCCGKPNSESRAPNP